MKLFLVTVYESDNLNCQRSIYVLARNLQEAAKKAEKYAADEIPLYKPHALKVEWLGPLVRGSYEGERTMPETWEDLCESMGWNEDSKREVLEAFIQKEGMWDRFEDYARQRAEAETEEAG